MDLTSVIPFLSAVNNTTAEKSPTSVSFRASALNVLAKCRTDEMKSAYKKEIQNVVRKLLKNENKNTYILEIKTDS